MVWDFIDQLARSLYDRDTRVYGLSRYYTWDHESIFIREGYIESILIGGRTDEGYSPEDFDD